MNLLLHTIFSLLFILTPGFIEASAIQHDLNIRVQPDKEQLLVKDRVTFSHSMLGEFLGNLNLLLPASIKASDISVSGSLTASVEVEPKKFPIVSSIRVNVTGPVPERLQLEFKYMLSKEFVKGAFITDFILRPNSGDSNFLPLVKYRMRIETPTGWSVVSAGSRINDWEQNGTHTAIWESIDPLQDIPLVIDRFREFKLESNGIRLFAFLRGDEPDLAKRYLNATGPYIRFFQKMLGPYPYKQFALVENSRQTGYGLPSFTLLGSRVIRFPFILETSYPHEILHNWWGNGVYAYPKPGNWTEGLTTYLADHLMAELNGKGRAYRLDQLVKYLDYASAGRDFALTEFGSRHDMASQAVGYGKTLMMFHMLRKEIGNVAFLQSLRQFYSDHKFKHAGFGEIRKSFESVTGRNFKSFFDQWITRKGAIELEVEIGNIANSGERFRLPIKLKQKQALFGFTLPVGIWTMDDSKTPAKFLLEAVNVNHAVEKIILEFDKPPGKIVFDPYTDLFRKLDRSDIPSSIGQTYGAKTSIIVLPETQVDPESHLFAKKLAQGNDRIKSPVSDHNTPDETLWIVGRNNRIAQPLKEKLKDFEVKILESGVTVEGKSYLWKNHSFIFSLPHPDNPKHSATWVVPGTKRAVPGLIRKLPHYGKFGYVVFEGDTPDSRTHGKWPQIEDGRLTKTFIEGDYRLPAEPPLVDFLP